MISERSLNQFCKSNPELIENFKLAMEDKTQTWHIHHRLETHFKNGKLREKQLSMQDLKDRDLYFRRPPEELILLTKSEHTRLHTQNMTEETRKKLSAANKGRQFSEETRKKISESQKGKNLSEETRKKISESQKGKNLSEETKKKLSESQKGNTNVRGRRWYNNGIINVRAVECPDGFIPGRLKK